MKAQSFIVTLVIIAAGILAFGIPLMIIGDRVERRDDIVVQPRYTYTATPLDRAMTQEAFARLFFTDTAAPRSFLRMNTPIPSKTGIPTLTIPAGFPGIPRTGVILPPRPCRRP